MFSVLVTVACQACCIQGRGLLLGRELSSGMVVEHRLAF